MDGEKVGRIIITLRTVDVRSEVFISQFYEKISFQANVIISS